MNRRTAIKLTAAGVGALAFKPYASLAQNAPQPFGAEFPNLESLTTGEWWTRAKLAAASNAKGKGSGGQPPAPSMDVPRDEVVCFACYTQQSGVLKMSAQLFQLKPGEERGARLEVKLDGDDWKEIAKGEVLYPGWDAHFRVEGWDGSKNVPYRVRHGEKAMFEGLIRFDKKTRKITFECWPRFAKVADGEKAQFPGWPITIAQDSNDGRQVHARLPAVKLDGVAQPVVQVIAEATGEILYTVRSQTESFIPRVYAPGKYTVKAGKDKPDTVVSKAVEVT